MGTEEAIAFGLEELLLLQVPTRVTLTLNPKPQTTNPKP
jgi:hypothetical protein